MPFIEPTIQPAGRRATSAGPKAATGTQSSLRGAPCSAKQIVETPHPLASTALGREKSSGMGSEPCYGAAHISYATALGLSVAFQKTATIKLSTHLIPTDLVGIIQTIFCDYITPPQDFGGNAHNYYPS